MRMRRLRGDGEGTWALGMLVTGHADDITFGPPVFPNILGAMIYGSVLIGGLPGAFAGGLFGVALSADKRSESVEHLSLQRTAVWGAVAGIVLPALLVWSRMFAYSAATWAPGMVAIVALNGCIGAGVGVGMVKIAQRGERTALSP